MSLVDREPADGKADGTGGHLIEGRAVDVGQGVAGPVVARVVELARGATEDGRLVGGLDAAGGGECRESGWRRYGVRRSGGLMSHLGNGKKIQAIKAYRQATGEGLVEAKEAVERMARQHGL
jgi:Ribosomal protein L7/L12 C-terminal domain